MKLKFFNAEETKRMYCEKAQEMKIFIEKWEQFVDLKSINFFVEEYWEKRVPEEWKEPLLETKMKDLLLMPTGRVKETWPESLKEFIQKCNQICLDRSFRKEAVTPVKLDNAMKKGMCPKVRIETD